MGPCPLTYRARAHLAVVDVSPAPPRDPDAKTMAQVEPLLEALRILEGHATATAWLHAWQNVVMGRCPTREKPPARGTFNRHLKKALTLNLVAENGGEYVLK